MMKDSLPRMARRQRLKDVGQSFSDRVKQAIIDKKPVPDIRWNFEKPPVVGADQES